MTSLIEIKNSSLAIYRSTLFLILSAFFVSTAIFIAKTGRYLEDDFYLVATVSVLTMSAFLLLVCMRRLINKRLIEGDRAAEQRLQLLQTDVLTGALSRRLFITQMKECVRHAKVDQPCGLLLIDIDHFKALNDAYGHNTGDFALTHLVEVAGKTFPDARIGRLGGDEFAVLLEGRSAEDCLALAGDFISNLKTTAFSTRHSVHLSVSIGVASAPLHSSFYEEMTLLADLALYQSKRSGRGQATLFDPDMLQAQRYHRTIERDLRAAILLNELDLHYQPVVLPNGEIEGVEALARWPHPTRGMIPPCEFIPVAEETDLIDMLGEWVLRRACTDFDKLPGRTIGVNVSAAQLKRDEFVHMVLRTLRETGVRPTELVLEITENLAIAASPALLGRIQTLRNEGIRLSLDDFGTGHCGFNYLRHLPVDIIKIDRSYVSRMNDDPVSRIFVSAVVETARALGLTVLAEGVETETELAMAKAAGCSLFQGYLISRPRPLTSFMLSNRKTAA